MRLLIALIVLICSATAAMAQMSSNQPAEQPAWATGEMMVETRLISDMEVVTPGQDFYVGLHQIMPDHWHTYWRNPGDNGLAIELEWDMPEGLTIGDIVWPAPINLPVGDVMMDYGYEGEITFPLPIHVDEDYADSSITLKVEASWLVCEVICIPEEGKFELVLGVDNEARVNGDDIWYIRAALEAVPEAAPEIDATLSLEGGRLVLELDGGLFDTDPSTWRNLGFMPFKKGLIDHFDPQFTEADGDNTLLLMTPGHAAEHALEKERRGLLHFDRQTENGWVRTMVEIDAVLGEGGYDLPTLASAPLMMQQESNIALLLALALGGGLILNLMPCVFPVLSIKVLAVVEAAHDNPGRIRSHGLMFLAGVVLSFIALALLLLGLRDFGLPVGWGFQLQVPVVVASLALLLFAIGLNLLGAFDVGTSLQNVGGGLAKQGGAKGAFFTGMLAVVVAAPCVGPLAAGALGVALTQPPMVLISVSAMMGVGLALPFLTLSVFPSLLKFVPKPGAWMNTFKQALAFPMFASAIWMVWVLTIQSGAQGLLLISGAFLMFALAIWVRKLSGALAGLIALLALIGSIGAVVMVARLPAASSTQTLSEGERPWSRELVNDLRAEGRPVFIDVTAAWCVTCQLNKMRVMDDEAVQMAFSLHNVARLRADWTNRNDEIAALIAEHGGAGVPLYILYPTGCGDAEVLPTVLTRDGLIESLEAAAW
jgi:DsbC/DsbD-like thiol-disulfide interchange protein/cytochrome c biogenesis protein CcdA